MHFATAEDAAHFETMFLDVYDVYVRWYVTLHSSCIYLGRRVKWRR